MNSQMTFDFGAAPPLNAHFSEGLARHKESFKYGVFDLTLGLWAINMKCTLWCAEPAIAHRFLWGTAVKACENLEGPDTPKNYSVELIPS